MGVEIRVSLREEAEVLWLALFKSRQVRASERHPEGLSMRIRGLGCMT
jgi:hypothetical protein